MLTTTTDGLWVLQVLAGIEALAPELALRPILPSVETTHVALGHPACAELRAAGVVDDADTVDAAVVEWLTVLARRDVALAIAIRMPGDDPPARVLLARFARWWAVMERSDDLVRIGGAGVAGVENAANDVVAGQLERLCGRLPAAPLRPVTLDAAALRAAIANQKPLPGFFATQRLDDGQRRILVEATDSRRSAQAAIVAIQSGVATGRPTRAQVGQAAVTVMDSSAGRIVAEDVSKHGKSWMVIAPGTPRRITAAVNDLLRRLPAANEWCSHRRTV